MSHKKNNKRILITGINGFIGNALRKSLIEAGYDVWGIDKSSGSNDQIIPLDLLNYSEIVNVSSKLPTFSTIILTAAIAHNKSVFDNKSIYKINVKILENTLTCFANSATHIIFLSSTSVYGEDKRYGLVDIADKLRPSSFYAFSKVIGEDMINDVILNCDILRLAPVYDEMHLTDVQKRIFFPFSHKFKMILKPTPYYSFCSVKNVITATLYILEKGPSGKQIYNLSDDLPYSQNSIAQCYNIPEIIIWKFFTLPIYWLTYFLPKTKGYSIRCLYWKIFNSNVYRNNLLKDSNVELDLKNDLLSLLKCLNKKYEK